MCCSIQELEVQPYELVNVDLKSGTSNMARRLSYLLYNLLSNMPVIIRWTVQLVWECTKLHKQKKTWTYKTVTGLSTFIKWMGTRSWYTWQFPSPATRTSNKPYAFSLQKTLTLWTHLYSLCITETGTVYR